MSGMEGQGGSIGVARCGGSRPAGCAARGGSPRDSGTHARLYRPPDGKHGSAYTHHYHNNNRQHTLLFAARASAPAGVKHVLAESTSPVSVVAFAALRNDLLAYGCADGELWLVLLPAAGAHTQPVCSKVRGTPHAAWAIATEQRSYRAGAGHWAGSVGRGDGADEVGGWGMGPRGCVGAELGYACAAGCVGGWRGGCLGAAGRMLHSHLACMASIHRVAYGTHAQGNSRAGRLLLWWPLQSSASGCPKPAPTRLIRLGLLG